ncbi:methylated-DNA--[protein]-cysteine S-methyltransferase [Deefgea salmonis]|uniref:Methylated-DNA--[protein]-cysteine S-methyltransferase n=1 Tax=Deefgea salmonis TaxID=2875502 RepID=A0ABS8BPH5_9NEIS|nr:methylated-DNA--[protein]-cysteine S-methyltransferase [Deefgea salmonis]MCB5197391.1 methylated-DNA--[protein]-cysteine S-methyltransferase [Deefgea salmonis]
MMMFSPSSDAVIATPFGRIGLSLIGDSLSAVDFLVAATPLKTSHHPLLHEAKRQISAYFNEPKFVFDLPYQLNGTPHQLKVWQAIAQIPAGEVLTYSEIARRCASSPRAVGGACGRNPMPLLIPCHRVVAMHGLGGFNANRNGLDWLPIKRWLLQHEGVIDGQ